MNLFLATLTLVVAFLTANGGRTHGNRALIHRRSTSSLRSSTIIRRSTDKNSCEIQNTCNANPLGQTMSSPKSKATTPPPHPRSNANSEVQNVNSGSCGNVGATEMTTRLSGPNGGIDYLNCGLTSGGWDPPNVNIANIVYVPLATAIKSGSGPFLACSKFLHMFEQYGRQYGIPPIMLASFAMQESSCNPGTVGGAGEQGLMQLTNDKCGDAPGGDCLDPDFNVHKGAKYFAENLKNTNGNVILAVAQYNGWSKGMTLKKVTDVAKSNCCKCQQNLDYLHQFFNGWLQNIDAHDQNLRLGKFFNLDVCK